MITLVGPRRGLLRQPWRRSRERSQNRGTGTDDLCVAQVPPPVPQHGDPLLPPSVRARERWYIYGGMDRTRCGAVQRRVTVYGVERVQSLPSCRVVSPAVLWSLASARWGVSDRAGFTPGVVGGLRAASRDRYKPFGPPRGGGGLTRPAGARGALTHVVRAH